MTNQAIFELTNRELLQLERELTVLPKSRWKIRRQEYMNDPMIDSLIKQYFGVHGSEPGTFLHHYIAESLTSAKARGRRRD